MSASSWDKRYHKLVMDMNAVRPMDEEELRWDRRYAMLLVTFFVIIPLLAGIPFAITGSLLVGAIPTLISMGIGAAIGLSTRRRILNDFLRVDDAAALFEIGDLTDQSLLENLCAERAIAFSCDFDTASLAFPYNWLVARQALNEGEVVQAYRLRGTTLAEMYDSDVGHIGDFLVIPYSALRVSAKNELRFVTELHMAGGTWLGSLVESLKRMKRMQTLGVPEAAVGGDLGSDSGGDSLSNKGQQLS